MDQHPPTLPALGRDALGAQRTYPTYRPVELESLQAVGAICPFSRRHDGAGNLPRRTGATARGQVKVKVIFGKCFRSGRPGALATNRRPASAKVWRVPPSPSAASPMASSTGAPVLASLASTSSNAPRLSGALPGNTSTAVISWESVSTTMAALCPLKRRRLLCAHGAAPGHAPTTSGPCSPHP